ncbi:MAG: hypothetical protein Q9195_006446 [Heterodermia aff. obscurata]
MPEQIHSSSNPSQGTIQGRTCKCLYSYTSSKIAVAADDEEPTIEEVQGISQYLAALLIIKRSNLPPTIDSRMPPENVTDEVLQNLVDQFNSLLDRFSQKMTVTEQVKAAIQRSVYLYTELEKKKHGAAETEDLFVRGLSTQWRKLWIAAASENVDEEYSEVMKQSPRIRE